MLHACLKALVRGRERRLARRRKASPGLFAGIDCLEQRIVPAMMGVFSPATGVLTVMGDAQDNNIEVGRNAAGIIQINNGAVPVIGGTPSVANTTLIQVFGQNGNDVIALNESQGALPRANLFGGSGDDTITGGSGNDMLFGQAGNDDLSGMAGIDFLFGGADNDVLLGGDGNDLVFGESGNDRLVWNPGDDTDLNEGGTGIDTIEINGGGGSEQFTVTANGTRVRFDRLDPAPFSIDIGTSENLVVNMNGGDDRFSATGNLASLIQITADGGSGDDTILGSNGADLLIGGVGHDFIDGQQGNDVVLLGEGYDVFQWDPGDGSDTVEGQDGHDTMLFNGSAGNEIFTASPNGQRLQFNRNLGNIVMDLDGIENIQLRTLGGSDTVVLNDVSGTSLVEITVDLAASAGGGDTQADTVIVNGTSEADDIGIFGTALPVTKTPARSANARAALLANPRAKGPRRSLAAMQTSSVAVVGLPLAVSITGAEGANDSLVVNGLEGNDGISAATLPAGLIKLTADGGAGDDRLIGSAGADVFLGGADNDYIEGRQGDDVALLGSGDDHFQWVPGDGSDIVEGQTGADQLSFFGSDAAENFNVLANGGRVLLLRDVGNVTLDLNDLEYIDFRAGNGADNIVVGDLSGTDLTRLDLDLRGSSGGGDGHADSVTVTGTNGDDVFGAAGDAGGVLVFGLHTQVNIFHPEAANDRLTLNALGGNDVVDATSLEADGMQLSINGGLGDDVLIGSEGNDLINGGDGNDLVLMGDGDDTFVWNPGDDNDTLEGQDGFDTLLFNGSNVSENYNISANADRVRFFRDVANVTMDLDEVENINLNALGGADNVVVNDLTGTDMVNLDLNLAAVIGGGDAQPDTVIVNGTAADDVILAMGNAAGTSVFGLYSTINISGTEAANDRLVINSLAGDDVVEGTGLTADAIQLTANGGDDDDILLGGDGNDVLLGGDGDDVLIGGLGIDILDGGLGDNIVIQ